MGKKILNKGYICDNCLGRQFSQLLSGFTNRERGEIIRAMLAMEYDAKPFDVDISNFYKFKFRNQKVLPKMPKKCSLCDDFFKKKLSKLEKKAISKLKDIDFESFLVGTKPSSEMIKKEEELWESIGIKYCEPIKAEINREFGKALMFKLKKVVNAEMPDVNIIVDVEKNDVEIIINPLFIFGEYRKLIRGIPQTKWDMYDETVEDIIAKPIMEATKGNSHSFHGAGREDIDARCLDWRPFVFEVKKPKKRKINFKAIENVLNKSGKIKVKNLRISDRKEVRKVKELKYDKTYRVLIVFEKDVRNLERLERLKGEIKQYTPTRVLHRRSNRLRKRMVNDIKWKVLGPKMVELEIRAESGLYVKELVTGDNGRTTPSVSEVLENKAKVKQLDVLKIWKK